MLYHKQTTLDHPICRKYPSVVIGLNTMISQEGGKKLVKTEDNKPVISLDEIANAQRSGRTLSTMDIAFGIADERERNRKMVLTDFKFRKKQPKNFSTTDLDAKVAGSVQILGHCIQIEKKYYLITPKNMVSQAQADLRRLYKLKSPFEAICIEVFLDKFFDLKK
ncbi:hypothetical protein [Alistipes sp. ZOR0009]|uniref:hypothetical protein n=1 Tax=Alistipes sp. ZOR0009 TaxID=1339253 RepID=UPI000647B26F|nr:hypothetical protein [Alistipes sp. ZOR0009]